MENLNILVIGGGIAGLAAAIALSRKAHQVTVIERDPSWSVYGVGIIQQSNVVRAMDQLGVLDAFLDAACGFDAVEVYIPDGTRVARIPTPSLVEGRPSSVGISRRALQNVLASSAKTSGAEIRLGIVVETLEQDPTGVSVIFSDGSHGRFDVVVGADGVYSQTRRMILPNAEIPKFTGQSVWRYNFPRPEGLDALHVYNGPIGVGLVPMSPDKMYMYVTTPEPDNARYPVAGLAARMREKLAGTAPSIQRLAEKITDDEGVVYRPLESMMIHGPWHNGHVVLIGDAVHATTPHLGQGAGMAIEDALVLTDKISSNSTPGNAFNAYRNRRYERCSYIVEASLAICHGQIGKGPPIDNHKATQEMFKIISQPI